MLGKIRLLLRCIDYSLSMLIIVCCLAFGSWWFSAENYSYEESLYPQEEFCQDICKIYSDLATLSLQRKDWNSAIDAYQTAVSCVVKNPNDLEKIKGKKELVKILLPLYDRLTFCYKQLDDTVNVDKTDQVINLLNPAHQHDCT